MLRRVFRSFRRSARKARHNGWCALAPRALPRSLRGSQASVNRLGLDRPGWPRERQFLHDPSITPMDGMWHSPAGPTI